MTRTGDDDEFEAEMVDLLIGNLIQSISDKESDDADTSILPSLRPVEASMIVLFGIKLDFILPVYRWLHNGSNDLVDEASVDMSPFQLYERHCDKRED